jgi:hypothetical protein
VSRVAAGRADAALVDVGQQRDVRLAFRRHLRHRPPAEHPAGDIPALQQLNVLVPPVLADLRVQVADGRLGPESPAAVSVIGQPSLIT